MRIKTMDDFSVEGKSILLRADLNTSVINGRPELSERIKAHAKSIKRLCAKVRTEANVLDSLVLYMSVWWILDRVVP